jgi:hypothetical protein
MRLCSEIPGTSRVYRQVVEKPAIGDRRLQEDVTSPNSYLSVTLESRNANELANFTSSEVTLFE